MAFFSPGFMLGAVTRASELIEEEREYNKELAEEIKEEVFEAKQKAAEALSVQTGREEGFISVANKILAMSPEGRKFKENANRETLIAVGKDYQLSKSLNRDIKPKPFAATLYSNSFDKDGNFINPYNVEKPDLTDDLNATQEKEKKRSMGEKILQGIVGVEPTREAQLSKIADPRLRAATARQLAGQPVVPPTAVESGVGDVPTRLRASDERMLFRGLEETFLDNISPEVRQAMAQARRGSPDGLATSNPELGPLIARLPDLEARELAAVDILKTLRYTRSFNSTNAESAIRYTGILLEKYPDGKLPVEVIKQLEAGKLNDVISQIEKETPAQQPASENKPPQNIVKTGEGKAGQGREAKPVYNLTKEQIGFTRIVKRRKGQGSRNEARQISAPGAPIKFDYQGKIYEQDPGNRSQYRLVRN